MALKEKHPDLLDSIPKLGSKGADSKEEKDALWDAIKVGQKLTIPNQ